MRRVPRVVASILIALTTIAQLAPARTGVRIIASPHQSGIVDPLSSPRNGQVATESRPRRFVSTPMFERADSNNDPASSATVAMFRTPGRVQPIDAPFSPESFEPHAVHGRAPPLSR
ncbi:MAG TPA: hypothetical protein VL173_01105 [Vicinamibacterales bacterium]|nr:hypothetical protein [Vicinamibacterales bacterium]